MAKNISEKSGTVVPIGSGKRGPKPGAGRKLQAGAEAAAKANAMLGGPSKAEAANRGAPAPETVVTDAPNVDAPITAPSFGANEPDAGVFLREVNKIRRQMAEVEMKKLELKTVKGRLKDIRKLAAGVGLVMREVDEAIDALNTEHVDLIAREERRRLYFEWLGLPLGIQATLPGIAKPTDTETDQARWLKRGDIAGRLGEIRTVPEHCPPHCLQSWLHGWEAGQKVLMQGSVLTAGAFHADGTAKDAAELKPKADDDGKMVTFTEAHFMAGTDLEDANLKTLLPGHHEAFHNAENVVAVFGDKKRVLRERDDNEPSGFYQDTGEDDVPMSDPEPVAGSTAAEFS